MSLEDAVRALDAARAACPNGHDPWLVAGALALLALNVLVVCFGPKLRKGE